MSKEWEQNYVKIVHEKGHEEFFLRFLLAHKISHLTIISPWITTLKDEQFTLNDITKKIKDEQIETLVFMRSPYKEKHNIESAELFFRCPSVTLYYNNELHAKVYVCRCEPFGFALVGSANLSGNAIRAHEIGLLIDGKGNGVEIIAELQNLGLHDLPNRSGTIKLEKEGGMKWK
jgi:hypothetical protein